jgi:phage terminase large subunit-like protein
MPDVVRVTGAAPEDLELYLQAELELLRKNPLQYGHRLSGQQERWVASLSRHRIVVAGNRVGKTEGSMRDVLWCARGEHPYKKVKLHNVIWVGCPDYPSYIRYTKPAFDQWCPPEWIVGSFHESEKWVDIRRIDGGRCRIFFLSFDMERAKWQGAGVDGIWLDEEAPEDVFGECLARIVTTRGWILLTFTPVTGVNWWYDRIWEPALTGKGHWAAFQAALASRDVVNDSDYEVGESLVPHLSREQIIEFAREYPDADDRAIRVFGEVKSRRGLVYKGYSKDIHLIPEFRLPAHYDLWGAVDPGYHGFAAAIAGISPEQRTYVASEYFSQEEPTSVRFAALFERVRELRTPEEWGTRSPTVVFFVDTEDPQVIMELNIQAVAQAERDALEEKEPIMLAFASLAQGLKARKAGFLRVQQVLAPDPERRTPVLVDRPRPKLGEPLLYFFDSLHSEWQGEDRYWRTSRVLWEIERYSWRKPPKNSSVRPDDGDENSAGGAHACAVLRYLTMARLGPPESPESETHDDLDPVSKMVAEDVKHLDEIQLERAGY